MEEPNNPFSEVEIEAEETEPEYHQYQRPQGEGKGKKEKDEPVEKERVSKLIAKAGIASRRAAEDLITEGRVAINGHFVREPGIKINPNKDKVVIDGRPLVIVERETSVLVFHKPKYVMTTHDDPGDRVKVFDILPKRYAKMHSVGRLDFETTGVLLITDDGELTHLLTHPSHGFEKVYEARVRGEVTRAKIEMLQSGVVLEDGKTAPCRARVIAQTEKNALVELTLREGKNRQVRRMFEAIGHPVTSLRRTKFAGIELEGLPSGEFRVLLPGEVKALRKTVENGLKKLGAPTRPRPKAKIVNDKAEFKARRNSDDVLEAKAIADRAPMRKPARKVYDSNSAVSKAPDRRSPAQRSAEETPVRRPAPQRTGFDRSSERPNDNDKASTRRPSSERAGFDNNPTRRPSSERPNDKAPVRRPPSDRANDKAPTRRPSSERPNDKAPVRRPASEKPTDKAPTRRPASERPANDKSPIARRIERKWKD